MEDLRKLTNKEPKIIVKQEIKKIDNTNPFIHDTVCLIGGFETDENTNVPTLVQTIEKAEEIYGDDTSIDANAALRQILGDNKVSNVLIVNITTKSGDTFQRSLTATKLEDALEALDLIDFDILYIADDLTDAFITTVDTFAAARFEAKNPFGFVCSVSRASVAAYKTTAGKVGDFCYALINQKIDVADEELSLVESGAFITKEIALTSIADSLTAKVIPDITGLQDVYTFGTGSDGLELTGVGYLLFRLINATNNTYEAVNSANNNGLDLYISRVRDIIVRDFALRDFLGDRSNTITLEMIKMECNRIYSKFKALGLIEGMNFAVQKKDSETVEVIINTIQFAGIITEIDVFITIEVI